MDEEQKSSHTMEPKKAHSNSEPQTSQSSKQEDKSEGYKSTEGDSQNIESEINGIQTDNIYKTRNYSISGHLNTSSTQEQNEQNKECTGDRGELLQFNTFSCRDQRDFAAARPSSLSTDQQRTAANNPSHYGEDEIICCKCKTKFNTLATLKTHLLDDKNYTCNNCGRTYCNMHLFQRHVCSILAETFICRLCWQRFPEQAKLDIHKLEHISEGCVKCTKCGRLFRGGLSSTKHLKGMVSCDKYRCRLCQECFQYPTGLELHRATCHIRPEEQKVKLEEKLRSFNDASPSCSKSASDRRAIIKSESDMETRTSSCKGQNDKSFHSDSGRLYSHLSFTQKDSKPNEEGRMDCIELLQSTLLSFEHRIYLTEPGPSHQSTYQQRAQQLKDEAEINFACGECRRPFTNYRDFKLHYPFCRKLVESQRPDRNELNSHSDNSNHKTERNVKCERCSRRFSEVNDCKKHMIENPFCYMASKCPNCPKYFTSSELLQEHSTIHHEN